MNCENYVYLIIHGVLNKSEHSIHINGAEIVSRMPKRDRAGSASRVGLQRRQLKNVRIARFFFADKLAHINRCKILAICTRIVQNIVVIVYIAYVVIHWRFCGTKESRSTGPSSPREIYEHYKINKNKFNP